MTYVYLVVEHEQGPSCLKQVVHGVYSTFDKAVEAAAELADLEIEVTMELVR